MEARTKLLQALIKIKDDINQQIPLASNRFEQYETAPRDADFDEVDRKYEEHEVEFKAAQFEHLILEHVNETLTEFLKECGLADAKLLSSEQIKNARTRLIAHAAIICRKINRQFRVLSGNKDKTKAYAVTSDIEKYLTANSQQLIIDWINHGSLGVRDADFKKRLELNDLLVEYRETVDSLFFFKNIDLVENQGIAGLAQLRLDKAYAFWRGIYFERINSHVGYCDEHTVLGLKKIFDDVEIFRTNQIEKVSIVYLDDNNQPDDGHTFLVINRDPDSQLNKMAEWGENAILFDPWNKLVCYATELDKQPLHYFSFVEGARWESLKFEWQDFLILSDLNSMDEQYALTGNDKVSLREDNIIDEYQLTPLSAPSLTKTNEFLQEIITSVWPAQLKMQVKFYITTVGNKLITSLSGFDVPAIVIHQHFIGAMRGDKDSYTVEQLRFALARELLNVQHFGVGLVDFLQADDEYKLDRQAIELTRLGSAAIQLLRYCHLVENEYKEKTALPTLTTRLFKNELKGTFENRIKAIMGLIAQDEHFAGSENGNPAPEICRSEVLQLPVKLYFTDEVKALPDKQQKAAYLKSRMPELSKELLPFEHIYQGSARVEEFCDLLRGLGLNLAEQADINIAHELVNEALRLRIPAFGAIYCAIIGQSYKPNGSTKLPPLGLFYDFQAAIDDFVRAPLFLLAKSAAKRFLKYQDELQNHLMFQVKSTIRISEYIKTHGHAPQGADRPFRTDVGECITWRGFAEVKHSIVPWRQHVQWAEKDASGEIIKVLWALGVREESRLWKLVEPDNLLQLLEQPEWSSRSSSKRYARSATLNPRILHHLSYQHKVMVDMFNVDMPFEDAFVRFYDANWPMLIMPSNYRNINIDNAATDVLMTQFVIAAQSSNEAAKKTVKSFFMEREDKRDLFKLSRVLERDAYDEGITGESHYVKFILFESYKDKIFKLFTIEEKFRFLWLLRIWSLNLTGTDILKIIGLFNERICMNLLSRAILLIQKHADFNSRPTLVDKLLGHYVDVRGLPSLFSSAGAAFVLHCAAASYNKGQHYLTQFTWKLPSKSAAWANLSAMQLIQIYQVFDVNLLFTSIELQQQFAKLILDKIKRLTKIENRIKYLTEWLCNNCCPLIDTFNEKYYPPMTDILIRNQIIDLLIGDIVANYGKDNGKDDYKTTLTKLIDNYCKRMPKRDLNQFLIKLADGLSTQAELSHYIGVCVEPDKYDLKTKKERAKSNITQLAYLTGVANILSRDEESRRRFIDFLASPLTQKSLQDFAKFVQVSKFGEQLLKLTGKHGSDDDQSDNKIKPVVHSIYHAFWGLTLHERAAVMESFLIPPKKVLSDEAKKKAYLEGVTYVSGKLFPNKENDEDEHFADAFISSYLEAASQHVRPYLMAGLLVAANESQTAEKISVGKKLAMFCESMGPAYIKLAQAIHSHPRTPEALRCDLHHVKGKANPPSRWNLWILMENVLSELQRNEIKLVGRLLGSASYNLALEVTLNTGEEVVLLLLRENAARDAIQGFAHLQQSIQLCGHPRMLVIRDAGLSILKEAEKLSQIEMDHELSAKQAEIAATIYPRATTVKVLGQRYQLKFVPAAIKSHGVGYRFMDRMYGDEYNNLSRESDFDRELIRYVAKEVLKVELINIFSGSHFDSDRHGNQMRVHVDQQTHTITLGLYDFGEMSLEKPSAEEIQLLVNVIKDIPDEIVKTRAFDQCVDELIARQVDAALQSGISVTYLMRVRKAILALQDFQRELTNAEFLKILAKVSVSGNVHPLISAELKECVGQLKKLLTMSSIVESAAGLFKSSPDETPGLTQNQRPKAVRK